ncbi:BlaI/MecI/CopY family transcriptional regulator [Portibacter lacus]|uniref:Transcriptional regulator n=1 Tax=Portibacter lacus TaxID=1099794 RepID=A0AA37WFQ0_9BACT|nr:BlaI/MecI/CopY family transcriptional regulator [Portibacter lacus]GLR19003.1 transcriptional regulator [Portibacter lacus]
MIRRYNEKEEEVMYILWKLKKAYVQDILNEMPEPKPHYNTVSSTVRKLEKEGHIGHTSHGRSHKYYAISKKKGYRSVLFEHLYNEYFGSEKKFLAYTIEKLQLKKSDVLKIMKKR